MAFKDATLAQRQAVRNAVIALDKATTLAHDTGPLDTRGSAVDTAAAATVVALNAAGSGSSGTSIIIANGKTAPVKNSAGTTIATGTATVASGALSDVKLPAKTAGVNNAQAVKVPITFTTARTAGATASVAATFTVANGVITAITIA